MIYFIQEGELGPIKIGYSAKPEDRKATHKTSNPTPLHTLLVIDGDRKYEAGLHRRFRNYKVRGTKEWFYPVEPILEFVELHRGNGYEQRRRVQSFTCKAAMAQYELFNLSFRQLFDTPPGDKGDEYGSLILECDDLLLRLDEIFNDGLLDDDHYHLLSRALLCELFRLMKELSPSYKKWVNELEKAHFSEYGINFSEDIPPKSSSETWQSLKNNTNGQSQRG